jgi:hypothetical protein
VQIIPTPTKNLCLHPLWASYHIRAVGALLGYGAIGLSAQPSSALWLAFMTAIDSLLALLSSRLVLEVCGFGSPTSRFRVYVRFLPLVLSLLEPGSLSGLSDIVGEKCDATLLCSIKWFIFQQIQACYE